MRIVIALGGNALGNDAAEQQAIIKNSITPIMDLIEAGHDIVLTHGNGPQVGMIKLAMDNAQKYLSLKEMPMAECVAMSQGYIGYHLQKAIRDELARRKIDKEVVTITTEVVVDKQDESFKNPTKPIGSFYTEVEAAEMRKQGYSLVEDSGRGYRVVVASPKPIDILQKKTIDTLLNAGEIVITVGGGGIPVTVEGNETIGKFAVIDKDFASSKLAEMINADFLVILTAVDKVAINFGEANEKWLDTLNEAEVNQYIQLDEFGTGSMLPKVKAALDFAVSGKDRKALITSLEKVKEGLEGKTGTLITQ